MKEYQAPIFELVRFQMEDVLGFSSGEGGFNGDSESKPGDEGYIRPIA